jgi:UDP-N-acetylmuramate dehydrogenase
LTTLRVGGTAEWLCVPSSREGLVEAVRQCRRLSVPYRVMGRGSNLLVREHELPGVTIQNIDSCREIEVAGRSVRVGASVSLQRLITACGRSNLGGIEYLHSVPANVGGAVFMNAGRGEKHRMSIGDRIVEVEFFDGTKVRRFKKRRCRFEYRQSAFHAEPECVILGATIELDEVPNAEVVRRIRERIEFTKETQDTRFPNAGTVFKRGWHLGGELKGVRLGGAGFSDMTPNWIVCFDGARSGDVEALLSKARDMHEARGFQTPELEWIVW